MSGHTSSHRLFMDQLCVFTARLPQPGHHVQSLPVGQCKKVFLVHSVSFSPGHHLLSFPKRHPIRSFLHKEVTGNSLFFSSNVVSEPSKTSRAAELAAH